MEVTIKIKGDIKRPTYSDSFDHDENAEISQTALAKLCVNGTKTQTFCEGEFTEYMDDELSRIVKSDTGMVFDLKNFTVETSYVLKGPPTHEEIKELAEYTQGQWSDGIGEGFEQFPCATFGDKEVYIQPWHEEQKLTVSGTN